MSVTEANIKSVCVTRLDFALSVGNPKSGMGVWGFVAAGGSSFTKSAIAFVRALRRSSASRCLVRSLIHSVWWCCFVRRVGVPSLYEDGTPQLVLIKFYVT